MPRLIDDALGAIGDIKPSFLTEAQFQAMHGTGWILADGRNVSGSKYAQIKSVTVVPDLRGMALRGKNNGRSDGNQNPDGDLALGAYQADQYKSHTHSISQGLVNENNGGPFDDPGFISTGGAVSTTASGGNETRMKNVTCNHFVRIN